MKLKGFLVSVNNDGASYYYQEGYSERKEAVDAVCRFIKERGEEMDLSEQETMGVLSRFQREAENYPEPEIEILGEVYSISAI